MNDDVRISVALVTRDRPASLRHCLESLRAQSAQPFEVVVSDDSGEEHVAATRRMAAEYRCRYVEGPRRGLYANRNSAARQCAGTHVRTMDDDHTFPEGHFTQCIDAVRSDPRSVWTTGETGYIGGKFYDRAETASQLHPSGVGCPVQDLDDNWAVADGSTIYPAEIFKRGLWMVEDFAYGMSYLEFGAYISKHGFRSRCVRGALVEHHAEPATVGRDNPGSRLFASLCYNLHFRPDVMRAVRYSATTLLHTPWLAAKLLPLARMARLRWS